jgi:3',5'-cyclic AMP phosphodiesterase CpdA
MDLSFPHPLFCSLLLVFVAPLAAHPDHHLRHWEQASPDPDRIVLTWAGDPSTSQAVTWRTDDSVEQAFAEIAVARPDVNFHHRKKTLTATTETLRLADPSTTTVHYHSVGFTALEPDTLYAYRVGSGDRWSEWIQFRTAAAQSEPFSFLYFGDAQKSVLSEWSRVVRAACRKAPHAAFSIHAGDLVNTAHRDLEWAEWFKAGEWMHSSVPSVPVPGNHEYGELKIDGENQGGKLAIQWRRQFRLPVVQELPPELAETVYCLDYQGVRVIALNSNRAVEPQAAWLDQVLTDNPCQWTVVTLHHPIFSSGLKRDSPANRALLKPIIDKHQVDLVLQGHDHTYARGHTPVRMSEAGKGPIKSLYVNSVSGPKMYDFREGGWNIYKPEGAVLERKAEGTPFFQVIDVDGDDLTYRAFMANGELYDAVHLRKRADGSKELLPWNEALGKQRIR